MVPITIAGLTTGNDEQRENAAYAIGDLVERTQESATSIKPSVVPFTLGLYGRRAGSGNFSDFRFQLSLLNKPV